MERIQTLLCCALFLVISPDTIASADPYMLTRWYTADP